MPVSMVSRNIRFFLDPWRVAISAPNIPAILVINTSIPVQKLKIRIIPHRIRPYLSRTGPLPFRASTLRHSPGANKGDFLDPRGADPLARFDNDD
jgi:hypothetical protein